jgi:hypothetical protein
MANITEDENNLLKMLGSTNVLTLGKGRMKEVQAFIYRLMYLVDNAETAKNGAERIANGLWLAASGALTEDQINNAPHLTDEQKGDLLKVVQLRYDADEWRAHCQLNLPELPSVAPPQVEEIALETTLTPENHV